MSAVERMDEEEEERRNQRGWGGRVQRRADLLKGPL